jgi:hypothetical protein
MRRFLVKIARFFENRVMIPPRQRPARSLLALALATLVPDAATQISSHQSLLARDGGWDVLDHRTLFITQLTAPPELALRQCKVRLISGASGYASAFGGLLSDVYSFTVSGNTVTPNRLNAQSISGRALRPEAIGGVVWFAVDSPTVPQQSLRSVPVTGGPVTTHVDLATLSGFNGAPTAVAGVGTDIYVVTNGAPGCLVRWDTTMGTGAVVRQLPWSLRQRALSATDLQVRAGKLHIAGVYGDYLVLDSVSGAVDKHVLVSPPGTVATLGSFDIDDATQDLLAVSFNSTQVFRIVSGEAVTQFLTANLGDSSLGHVSAVGAGTEFSYGAGCPGNNGYTLIDASIGLPTAGNNDYRFAAWNGSVGDVAAMMLATRPQIPPIDLGIIGMTPDCFLHVDGIFSSIPVGIAGAGLLPRGVAVIRLQIPQNLSGAAFFRQWAELQANRTNSLGVVISNARQMNVQ